MKAIAISSENLHKSHETFRTAESIFSVNNLLIIMNGVRQQPEPTTSNPTGYRSPCIITYKGIDYRISADDVGKYDHDFSRCFQLLFYLCHRSIYYLAQEEFLNQNPNLIYAALKEYFSGPAGKDMIRINRLINEFKVDNSVPIQKDVVRLDNYYRELDAAVEKKMHEELKMAQLMSIFQFDKRPGVEVCMAQISFCNFGYGQTIITIMELANTIDSTHTRHQMKSLSATDKKTELCRGFSAGKCKFGDKCKYIHKGPSSATAITLPPPSKLTATNKHLPKTKKNPPSYITAIHCELVGPPMGRPREGNPIGYSRKQMYALNVLTRNSDIPSNNGSTGDNWCDGSILWAAQGGATAGQK